MVTLHKLLIQETPAVMDTAGKILRQYRYSIYTDGDNYVLGVPESVSDNYLLVAHADTVRERRLTTGLIPKIKTKPSPGGIKFNGIYYYTDDDRPLGADDRAGIYIILQLLGRGLRPLVLITNYEEEGGRGVREFCYSDHLELIENVLFFVEFDRRGINQYVTYAPVTDELQRLVEEYGFIEEYGSYSDVSTLTSYTEIAHVNISAGYIHEHTPQERLYIPWVEYIIDQSYKMLSNYKKFITKQQKIKKLNVFGYSYYDYHVYGNNDYYDFLEVADDILHNWGEKLSKKQIKKILKKEYKIYDEDEIDYVYILYKNLGGES